jgi:hypothetical protein
MTARTDEKQTKDSEVEVAGVAVAESGNRDGNPLRTRATTRQTTAAAAIDRAR